MKKYISLLILVICALQINAQNIIQKSAYQFSKFVEVDNNQSYQCNGLIVFSVVGSHEFITIMIGDEVLYNGEIKYKKPAQKDGNEVVYVYLFTTEFQGIGVPIQLFERWDTRKSTVVPIGFVLSIHDVNNGTCVQTQAFEGISRVK
jgi:hypothetical protein